MVGDTREIEYTTQVVVETNGDEWFIADKSKRSKVLEPKEYGQNTNEEFLQSVAENNPRYAEYITSHIEELSHEIDDMKRFLKREAADVELARLMSEMSSGGYGDENADSRAYKRIEQLKSELEILDSENVSRVTRAEPAQPTLFDLEESAPKPEKKIAISENPEIAKAIDALRSYARTTILYYDIEIRETFRSSSSTRADFDREVERAISDTAAKFSRGELTSELAEKEDFSALYAEMFADREFAENLYSEISDILYAEHTEIAKARETAHEVGLPYDEYPYDPEENFDPYAYDPNRMSDEDYDRMHDLIDAERAEAEKLIDKTVRIEDLDYQVEGIISNGADGFVVKLHSEPTDKYNVGSTIYEDVDVVREMLERQEILKPSADPQAAKDESVIAEEILPHNYCFPKDFSYSRGAKAKYADNVAAIKVLQAVERERRSATPDEQAILARYSGWGGIADVFDESKSNWHSEYVELKSLLSNSEYEAARASTLTAFYTEPYIINSIYKGLEHFGFKGGYILDPSMGTGNFFGNMPYEMAENSKLFGVELDSLTSRIAKQLYPSASIQHKGFEQTKFPDKMFDVVVGNVPFGDFKPYDSNYDDEYLIHDYFCIKSLDKLKTGGIAVLITSSGTLDKYNNQARLEMYRRADLIGAIRLPDNAFKSAGTEAVTDILFFQKSNVERDIDNITIDELPDWVKCDGVRINDLWFNCNTYFGSHTENILGVMKKVSGPYGMTDTVEPYENGDIEERLDNAVMGLNARFYAEPTLEELPENDEKEELPEGVRPFTYYVQDGVLYFAEITGTAEYTAKDGKSQQRIIDMCGIAEQVDTIIAIQRDGCTDDQLNQEQEILNNRYERFIKTHGNLSDPINRRLFQDDIRAPKLTALEIESINERNETVYKKADIFSKRTVNQQRTPDHADNAIEALHISLNLKQCVDIRYIARLCGKSEDEVIDELDENIYCNPVVNNGDKYSGWETAEEYLSGYTKEKLGLAMVKAEENPDFARNVEALKKHQPIPVPITGIGFRLGSMFVPKEMFTQFMWDTFESTLLHRTDVFKKDMISAEYISALNEWRIPNKTKERSVKVNEMFGTGRINAYELTELTLNQKKAEIKDKTVDDNGNEKYVLNRKETILAREKQRKIENAFRDWVLSNPERIKRVESIFNERYNSITPRKYDGSYIDVPGMAAGLDFMPHQKNAIARFANGSCGLVAHEVGAGKTAFSAGLGMYLKSIGAINKPMYVVPNAVIGQFGEEFMRFFPESNILVANDKDFEKINRRRFLAKISAGNYDAVIISQSQFEKIPLSLERQEEMYDKKINELTLSIAEMKRENGERLSVKKLESQRKSLQKNIEKLRAAFKKDDFVTFEDLGCDYLIVDEAHNYKNLALFSKMHNVAGVNTSSNSQRAFDLECKTRYLQEINNGGGVILMTGTPISNAISEMFVWQYLLQYPRLKELGIEYFDNWASVFGNITQALEVKPSGSGFRMRTRFSQFVNLPELCNIFGEIADIVKTSELDIALPQMSGGKPKMIICEKSPTQEEQTENGLAREKD